MQPRERLLDSAIDLLAERGYARTTTRAIVERAGAHLPAVNYYYGSKDRLLEEAIVEALSRWTESSMAAAVEERDLDLTVRLELAIDRFMESLGEHRPNVLAAVEAFAQAGRSDPLRERLAAAYDECRRLIAAEIAQALGAGGDELAASSVVLALFDGLAIQWLLDPDAAPSAAEVAAALAGLGSGLAAQPAG